jgi:hypothetical protein
MDEMTDNQMTTAEVVCSVCGKVTQHLNGKCRECIMSELREATVAPSSVESDEGKLFPAYIVFLGRTYYPDGGMDDFFFFASSLDEVIGIDIDLKNNWLHVYGVAEGKIVWRNGSTLYESYVNNVKV